MLLAVYCQSINALHTTYRCAHGILKVFYGEGDLKPFDRGVNLAVEGWEKDIITGGHTSIQSIE